jgi:ketosteroid isomerase-like protein
LPDAGSRYVHCERCGTTLQSSAYPRVTTCPRCFAEGEYPVPSLTEGVPPEGMHPDLDVVQRAFRLLERGDRDQMFGLLAEDFDGRTISTGELVQGPAGARTFLQRANEGQNELEPVVFRFEPNGRGQVAVFGRLRVRRPEGVVDTPAVWIYSVADGRIHHAESYTSAARAQRALRELANREGPA